MALPNLNRQELFFRPKPHFYSLMKTKEESSVLKDKAEETRQK